MTSAEVSSQQSGMGGEDGGHVQFSHAAQDQANASEPFVKVTNHIFGLVAKLLQKLIGQTQFGHN